jgi:hypothetical protein
MTLRWDQPTPQACSEMVEAAVELSIRERIST